MALVLDTTIGGEDSNSYISLADAETVMESVLYKDDWEAATDDNKNIALVLATRTLDEEINFYGSRTSADTQALEWPRYNCPKRTGTYGWINYFDSDIIPDFVEYATTVLANSLLGEDRSADSDTKGFKELKVDVLFLKVDKDDRADVLPDKVWDIVKFYGTKASSLNYLVRV